MEMNNEIIVFTPANIVSILQPIDQEVIFTFNSCHLKHIFQRATPGTDSDSSDEFQQSQMKTFYKWFTILDAIKNICNS